MYVVGFAGYGFVAGSAEYLAGVADHAGCETPGSRFGWAYEAINYDRADDARLLAANPDPTHCKGQGSVAGRGVVASDGVQLAGWYIPAAHGYPPPATGAGPAGPTVVIVHGGKSNKSGMLAYAPPLHDAYNLLIVDLRNSGRSAAADSTGGLHEQRDLRAMLDWLARVKHPAWIAVVGNSNGAATALAEALGDQRVRALVLDSMHAGVERQIGNVIVTERHLPAWPAAWALVAGVSFRLGESLESVDPVRSIARLDGRPVMLTHGEADLVDRPSDSLELNVAAALAAGVNLEFHVCAGAGHGRVVEVCAAEWAAWVQTFLAANGP
jgi:pimeloyl-ACP methyl ester carboxylesterase